MSGPKLELLVVKATGIRNVQRVGKQDPYCICSLANSARREDQRTHTANDQGTCPEWNKLIEYEDVEPNMKLLITINDKNTWPFEDKLIGVCSLAIADVFGLPQDQFFEHKLSVFFCKKPYGTLTVRTRLGFSQGNYPQANPRGSFCGSFAPGMAESMQQRIYNDGMGASMAPRMPFNPGMNQSFNPAMQQSMQQRPYQYQESARSRTPSDSQQAAGPFAQPYSQQRRGSNEAYQPSTPPAGAAAAGNAAMFAGRGGPQVGHAAGGMPSIPTPPTRNALPTLRSTNDSEWILADPTYRITDFSNNYGPRNSWARYDLAPANKGESYTAVDIKDGRGRVCITEYRKDKVKTLQDRLYVADMVKVMTKVKGGKNIMGFHRAWETQEAVYVVTELCTGGDLFDAISTAQDGRFSEQFAADIMIQLLGAIQVIHSPENNIVHRNIAPDFIFFTRRLPEGELRVGGWDFATVCRPGMKLTETTSSEMYQAPEMVARAYSHKVDIWAAGCVLHALLTGMLPDPQARSDGVHFDGPEWLQISDDAKNMVSCMLQPDPARRAGAEELLHHRWLTGGAATGPLEMMNNLALFAAMNKFKQIARREIAAHLSRDKTAELMTKFADMDEDGSGSLSMNEIRRGFYAIDWDMTEQQKEETLQKIMRNADIDNDGELSPEEFLALMFEDQDLHEEAVIRAFRHFDRDGDNFITPEELERVFMEEKIQVSNLARIMAEGDANGDGAISLDEFREMIFKPRT